MISMDSNSLQNTTYGHSPVNSDDEGFLEIFSEEDKVGENGFQKVMIAINGAKQVAVERKGRIVNMTEGELAEVLDVIARFKRKLDNVTKHP